MSLTRSSFLTRSILLAAVAIAACGGDRTAESDVTSQVTPSAVTMGGEQIYQQRCVSCHQANGEGLPGSFPPLAGSEFATATNIEVPVRVVLHGIEGPLMVKGQRFEGVMPPFGLGVEMSDEEVAAVLTYVRSSWGNAANAVSPQDVARIRSAPRSRTGSVTEDELRALMKAP